MLNSKLLRRVALLGLLAAAPGCNILGALAYKVNGPAKNPAEYAPPKDQPLVIVVENYRNPGDLQQPADQLAAMISDKLAMVKVAPIISADKLVDLRADKGSAYDKMKIPDIGRAVGAKQVIYVNLKDCRVDNVIGGDDIKCHIAALVKVVDVETGVTKWPLAGEGKEFKRDTDYSRSEGRRTELSIRDTMLDDISSDIAELFFSHQPDSEAPKDTD